MIATKTKLQRPTFQEFAEARKRGETKPLADILEEYADANWYSLDPTQIPERIIPVKNIIKEVRKGRYPIRAKGKKKHIPCNTPALVEEIGGPGARLRFVTLLFRDERLTLVFAEHALDIAQNDLALRYLAS